MAGVKKLLGTSARVPVPAEAYDTVEKARGYDQAARELMAYPMERVVSLVGPHCRECARLLHVGCETGVLALMLGGRYPLVGVVGIEENPAFLRVAEENALLAHLCRSPARVDFQPGAFADLPVGSESFDVVFTCNALYRCEDPARLLRECARVCRPEGLVLLYELIRDADRDMLRFVNRYLKAGQVEFTRTVQASYTRAEIKGLLARSGLSHWRIAPENMVVTVTSREVAPAVALAE